MEIVTDDKPQKTEESSSRGFSFVKYITTQCKLNNGLRAALTRADNPATEYQSWEVLAGFNVDLENKNQRLPFATIAAAIARNKVELNGLTQIGQAITKCYEDGNASDQAKAKLRRLLACDSAAETCRILRPLFNLIASKGNLTLNYASLLDDLLWFSNDDSRERIKARWAQDFYKKTTTGSKHD